MYFRSIFHQSKCDLSVGRDFLAYRAVKFDAILILPFLGGMDLDFLNLIGAEDEVPSRSEYLVDAIVESTSSPCIFVMRFDSL